MYVLFDMFIHLYVSVCKCFFLCASKSMQQTLIPLDSPLSIDDPTLGASFRTLCNESKVTDFIQALVPGAFSPTKPWGSSPTRCPLRASRAATSRGSLPSWRRRRTPSICPATAWWTHRWRRSSWKWQSRAEQTKKVCCHESSSVLEVWYTKIQILTFYLSTEYLPPKFSVVTTAFLSAMTRIVLSREVVINNRVCGHSEVCITPRPCSEKVYRPRCRWLPSPLFWSNMVSCLKHSLCLSPHGGQRTQHVCVGILLKKWSLGNDV